jgi:hypothetical protein
MLSSVRLAFHPWCRPQTLNLPNRCVRTRTHSGVGGGSREASPYPDNSLPRGCQAIEKRAEVVGSPCRRLAVAIAYNGELLLHISNYFQQSDRIECSKLLAQLVFDCFINIRRG